MADDPATGQAPAEANREPTLTAPWLVVVIVLVLGAIGIFVASFVAGMFTMDAARASYFIGKYGTFVVIAACLGAYFWQVSRVADQRARKRRTRAK